MILVPHLLYHKKLPAVPSAAVGFAADFHGRRQLNPLCYYIPSAAPAHDLNNLNSFDN